MLRLTLTLSAIYLALVGIGLLFFPLQFGVGAVPQDATASASGADAALGGPFLGIAVLNWLSRNAQPSTLKDGAARECRRFGAVAANDILGVATGEARDVAKYFLVLHLGFALAFVACARPAIANSR